MSKKDSHPYPPHDLIRDLRNHLGQTQVEFAKECGMHPVYLSHVETGHKKVGGAVVLRIWDKHKRFLRREWRVDVEQLLTEQG